MKRQSETTGQLNRDGTTYAEAKAGRKNILLNPNGVINQRGWDGNWSATPANVYGPDRWRRQTGTNKKEQPIVEGEYRPNTVYTLSGTGIATEQLTSPASGNWNISVPFAATDLQLEEGDTATPQEWRSESYELWLCMAYVERCERTFLSSPHTSAFNHYFPVAYVCIKRVVPTVTRLSNGSITASTAETKSIYPGTSRFYMYKSAGDTNTEVLGGLWLIDAEVYE